MENTETNPSQGEYSFKFEESQLKKFKLAEIVNRFFRVVVKNSRFEILESVVNEYSKLLNESRGVKLVTLEFAANPNKKLVNMIREYLENKLNKTIEFNLINNESLIGGVIIKHDSLLYDYSIAGAVDRAARLAKLAKLWIIVLGSKFIINVFREF